MLHLVWADVRHRTSRLLMSIMAIAIGAAFVVGTLVAAQTMQQAMLDQLSQSARSISAVVDRDPATITGGSRTVPLDVMQSITAAEGVIAAAGEVWGPVTVVGVPGRPLQQNARRAIALGIADEPRLRSVQTVSGSMPTADDQITIDRETAAAQGITAGERLELTGRDGQAHTYTVSGIIDVSSRREQFGSVVVVGLPTREAVALLGATAFGRVDVLAAPGVSDAAVADRLRASIPTSFRVRTGEQVRQAERADAAADVAAFRNTLLLFAGISLLVAAFTIFNTFAILVAQRMRETALLRCIGAQRRQVFTLMLTESAVVGLIGAVPGVLIGMGLAWLLVRFRGAGDVAIGSTPLQIGGMAIALGVGVAVLVSVFAALVPTVRGTRTAPIDALREVHRPVRGSGRARQWVCAGLLLAGAALAAGGLIAGSDGSAVAATGIGTLLVLCAVVVGGRLVVPGLAAIGGRTVGRLFGRPGRLAGDYAQHNPGRMAITTAALTISFALVTAVSTITAVLTSSLESRFHTANPFAYTIQSHSGAPFPADVVTALSAREGVAGLVAVRGSSSATEVSVKGRTERLTGVDPAISLFAASAVTSGSLADFGPGDAALDEDLARRMGLAVGHNVTVTGLDGTALALTVVALLDSASPIGPFAVADADLRRIAPAAPVSRLLVKASGESGAVRAAANEVIADEPVLTALSAQDSLRQRTQAMDTLRGLLLALLGLSVLIAAFSVANTFSLSILERTRELGLFRALGLTRREVRRMLSAEGVIVSIIGGGFGVLFGVAAGWALAIALGARSASVADLPFLQLLGYLLAASAVGLLATAAPARRGARAPIVAAIKHD